MARPERRRWMYVLVGLGAWAMAGCSLPPGYISSAIRGELAFLGKMVPIEVGLANPELTDEQRDKLAYMIRARDHAEQVIGLVVGNNFRHFVYLGDGDLAWNLSASRSDALEPYVWSIPVIGQLPYLGFFELSQAEAERDRLIRMQFDTFIYPIDGFALPILPDPVTSVALARSYGQIADLVFHELTHNTVNKLEDTTFSESLAVFVARTASREFLAVEFGEDAPEITELLEEHEDEARFIAFVHDLFDELEAFYASDLSAEEKRQGRGAIFDAARARFAEDVLPLMHNQAGYEGYAEYPFNNAFLLLHQRYYTDLDVFAAAFELVGREWEAAFALFAEAAAADDSLAYLRAYVEAGEAQP